jgi:hypothetical protein
MIVRQDGPDYLCITQPDHAALAGRIAAAWQAGGFPARPTRARVIAAAHAHDIGWQQEDDMPRLDPEHGRPYDFMSAPARVRQEIWPRGVQQLAGDDPYVAALVAQHALTVYRRHQHEAEWRAFFPQLERLRDDLYVEAAAAMDAPTSFLEDYSLVGICDLCSLVFCNAWPEPHLIEGYQVILRDDVLTIAPDPFAGMAVPLAVTARRLPARRYATAADLGAAWTAAATVTLTGTAAGARYPPPS